MGDLGQISHARREELVAEVRRRAMVPEARTLIDALSTPTPSLHTLALDRRRLAVPAESYEELIEPLGAALRYVFWIEDPEAVAATHESMAEKLREMAAAAREADLAGIPPATAAQVIGVRPVAGRPGAEGVEDNKGTSVGGAGADGGWAVYLEAPVPLDYAAGQTLPVLAGGAVPATPAASGSGPASAPEAEPEWLELAPAIPANDFGQVVFFLPPGTPAPETGQLWTLGHPRGAALLPNTLATDGGPASLDGTGERLAAARAEVFALAEKLQNSEASPRVELVVDETGAKEPGLTALAETADWLEVHTKA